MLHFTAAAPANEISTTIKKYMPLTSIQHLLHRQLQLHDRPVALVSLPQQPAALKQRAWHCARVRLKHRRLCSFLMTCRETAI
jgi:hypothetical protein